MAVKAQPDGYHAVTPYLIVKHAVRAIEFYVRALGASELLRLAEPGGRIGHAELRIGDSVIMLADEFPEVAALSPETLGGPGVSFLVYVEDVDRALARALAAGGKELRPVKDQFYGDRTGSFEDPFGHHWTLATHVVDVSPDELQRHYAETSKNRA
jgi:PhnB protein